MLWLINFSNIFDSAVPSFATLESLQTWQEKNHKWLELTDVHRETTNNIRVTVMPFYMGTKVDTCEMYKLWGYTVDLEKIWS